MRKVPIDTIATALRDRIRSNAAGFNPDILFADLDEFWNLETVGSNLQLPCVVVEFVQAEMQPTSRDVLQIEATYRLNYLCRVPDAGGKRSTLLAGTRYLAELFTGSTGQTDATNAYDGGLSLGESGIDQAQVVPIGITLNNSLAERAIGWGMVTVVVTLQSYPGA